MEIAFLLVLALPAALYGVFRPLHRAVHENGRRWWRVEGFDVPHTGGALFVHAIKDTGGLDMWVISHGPSGCRVSMEFAFNTKAGAIESAGTFWMELDDTARAAITNNDLRALANDRYARDIHRQTIVGEADIRITDD